MECILGIEEARRSLGEMVRKVSGTSETVVIARRVREKAVLMGYDEYRRLRDLAAEAASNKVAESLARIQEAVKEAGLPPSVVEEAVREVRSR
ncbi:MAG: type II toxin-antitoxin system Phd/YefM family antitoxin [Bacillota bacterium]